MGIASRIWLEPYTGTQEAQWEGDWEVSRAQSSEPGGLRGRVSLGLTCKKRKVTRAS